MKCKEIMDSAEFKKAVDFHGHLCPGLAIGFKAAKAAMDYFGENRSVDEELVCIVENDACGVDAVQSLTGCTFGKGNLIYRDYGKQVFFFVDRKTSRAVRVALKSDIPRPAGQAELIKKVRENGATEEDIKRSDDLRHKRVCAILEAPVEDIFKLEEVDIEMPEKAQIVQSAPCDRCGETTMTTRLENVGGKKICRECLANKVK